MQSDNIQTSLNSRSTTRKWSLKSVSNFSGTEFFNQLTSGMQQNSILIRLFPDERSEVSRPADFHYRLNVSQHQTKKEKKNCRFLKASKTNQYSETVLSKRETIELKHVGRTRFTDFPGDYTCSSFMVAITRKKKEKKADFGLHLKARMHCGTDPETHYRS